MRKDTPPNTCPLEAPATTAMRLLTLIYHEDFEEEINRIITSDMGVARYTKVRDVIGARMEAMTDHNYLPTSHNHMLILVAECSVVQEIARELKALRAKKGHGVRGYISPVDDII